MGILDTFELLGAPEKPFITLSKYGITFSRQSLELLHEANYVHTYLDKKNKKFAVKPCEYDEAAVELVKPGADRPNTLRWGNRSLLRTLVKLADVDVNTSSVRVTGRYYEDEDVIIYDLGGVK